MLRMFRTTSAIALLLAAIAGCATEPPAPKIAVEDFCSDPRIVSEMQKVEEVAPQCTASRVPFRHGDRVVDVAVASVLRGIEMSTDVGFDVTDSIVRLPDDRLVNLGRSAPVPLLDRAGLAAVMRALDIDADLSSATALQEFYAPVLEVTKRGYCVTYEMKPPFAGSVAQCAGSSTFFLEATYMPGATTWRQAPGLACALVDPADRCELFEQRPITDESGKAVYLVHVLHYLPAGSKFKYERLYYFVDVMTGVPTLRGRSMPNEPRLRPSELLKTS